MYEWKEKGGNVSEKKKMGRPVIGEKKDIRAEIRFDQSTLEKLDVLREKDKMTRSEYIRKLINEK